MSGRLVPGVACAVSLAALAACGQDAVERPLSDALFVRAEDGSLLEGEAWLVVHKFSTLTPQVTLSGGGPVLAVEPATTWSFDAEISRTQALADTVPEITWPSGNLVHYTSQHGAGDKGTAHLSFSGGRIRGDVRSENGRSATFDGGVHVRCFIRREDFSPPRTDLPADEDVEDTALEAPWCTPYKALRFR